MGELTGVGGGAVGEARREADEYRGDDPRPLGGYLAIMGVYVAVVAVAAVLAALTGRRLPARWRLQDLVILAVGTHKLSRTATKDAVTSPLRAPFAHYRGPAGAGEVREGARQGSQLRHSLGELLTCPYCFGMWVATGFGIGLVFAPSFTRLLAGILTALTGADFLQFAYAMAQRSAGE